MEIRKKRGFNLEDVQELNRALVIRLLRKLRVCSRAELAHLSGLKQATISNIIADLITWNLVTETGIIEGKKGRRSIGISLNTDLYKVIGVRLARKYYSIGLFDIFGSSEIAFSEPIGVFEEPENTLSRIREAVTKIINSASSNSIIGIGVAIPGPFFRTEGRIALMTEFPGWEDISLEDELRSSFQIPVFLEHDAKAGVLAEWWIGSHSRETGTMIYVAAGQGIGAGIIIDGKMLRGTLGTAGEIGHMSIDYDGPKCECGNRGCLEHYCSAIAIMREVKENLVNHPESPLHADHSYKSVVKAIEAGDPLACEVVIKAASYLGIGLVSVINAFNPDVIIIGDDLANIGRLLLTTVQNTVKKHILPSIYKNVSIELSSLAGDPSLMGISTLVVEKVLHGNSTIETIASATTRAVNLPEA